MSVSLGDLDKHLRLAKTREPDARVFAFHDTTGREFPAERVIDGETWSIVYAPSVLALRAALVDENAHDHLAIFTQLTNKDLGYDVRARIAENRLLEFDPWESVLPLFKANGVDARLRRQRALGEALLRASTQQFAPTRTDILSEEEAWAAAFEFALGIGSEPNTVADWIRWIVDYPGMAASLLIPSDSLMTQVVERARKICGGAVDLLFGAVRQAIQDNAPLDARLLAVGHALVAARRGQDQPHLAAEATAFRVRLEKYWGSVPLDDEIIDAFANDVAAAGFTTDQVKAVIADLDALFESEGGKRLAILSEVSALGFEQRLELLATRIEERLNGTADQAALREALVSYVIPHRSFEDSGDFGRRIEALTRLANRVAQRDTDHDQRADAIALDYIEEGAFEDWLREDLESADMGTLLNPVTRQVLEKADAVSELRNATFARRYAETIKASSSTGQAFFVQNMTEKVLAPLAKEQPVLLVVLDGLSWFVWHEILANRVLRDWNHFLPALDEKPMAMFATVPSITAFSRTSLLTGKLQTGTQKTEKAEFGKQPRLREKVGNKAKIALFHKGELDADGRGQVAKEVANVIRDEKHRVVGVVVNAIDDALAGSSQTPIRWSLETVTPLRSLLNLAVESNRVVLVVSDHGHVWESGSYRDIGATSARYRAPGQTGEGEIELAGPMIQASGQGKEIIAAWSEKVRYTRDKRGYHGGVSVQEVVAPCVVLVPDGIELDERHFVRAPAKLPPWWKFRDNEEVVRLDDISTPDSLPNLPLFQTPDIAPSTSPGWIRDLMESHTMTHQLKRIATAPKASTIEAIIATLYANKNRAHSSSIADALSINEVRAQRRIGAIQGVLNVDGFQVLSFDRAEQLVKLDTALLQRQFDIVIPDD